MTRLGEMLRTYRAVRQIGVRECAKQMGMSAATLSRIENGKQCDVPTFLKLVDWLTR